MQRLRPLRLASAVVIGGALLLTALVIVVGIPGDLAYDGEGGCQYLTAESRRDLTEHLLPVLIANGLWVVAVVVLLARGTVSMVGRHRTTRVLWGSAWGFLGVAGGLCMLFSPQVGAFGMFRTWSIAVFLIILAIALGASGLMRREEKTAVDGRWFALAGGWVLLAVGILPIVMLSAAGSGEVPIC